MESIYTVEVSKFLWFYQIKKFILPDISSNILYKIDNKNIKLQFNNKWFEYKIGQFISKSEYQMILYVINEVVNSQNYPVIFIELDMIYKSCMSGWRIMIINAPELDPSKHIVCHLRPMLYKYNNEYIINLKSGFTLNINFDSIMEDFVYYDILDSCNDAREIYYKYGDMRIDEYIEKVDMVSHVL